MALFLPYLSRLHASFYPFLHLSHPCSVCQPFSLSRFLSSLLCLGRLRVNLFGREKGCRSKKKFNRTSGIKRDATDTTSDDHDKNESKLQQQGQGAPKVQNRFPPWVARRFARVSIRLGPLRCNMCPLSCCSLVCARPRFFFFGKLTYIHCLRCTHGIQEVRLSFYSYLQTLC